MHWKKLFFFINIKSYEILYYIVFTVILFMKLNYSFQYIWKHFCVLKKRPWYKTQLKLNQKKKKWFFIHFRFRSVFLKWTFLGTSHCRDYEIDFLWIWFYLHEKCDFSYFFSNSSMKKWVTFQKKYYDLYSCGNLTCVVLCNRMRNEKNDKNSCFDLYNTGRNIFW